MADQTVLGWPFSEPTRRDYARRLDAWASANLRTIDHVDVDATCLSLVTKLGRVRAGHIVEALYREIRSLRIHEGASDVQKVVIARAVLAGQGS